MLDEFHLSFHAPAGLPEEEYDAINRTLDHKDFQEGLHQATTEVLRQYPLLGKISVMVSK